MVMRALVLITIFAVPEVAAAQARLIDLARPSATVSGEPARESERALALFGAGVAARTDRLPAAEARSLVAGLEGAYDRMEREVPGIPSPRSERHALRIEAEGGARDRAVIFLHGYGGPFALQCWAVARAARAAGWTTLCPSIGDEGDWWTARGEAEVQAAIAHLRSEGATRIALAGLSNGARGAAELAARVEVERVILISGASRRARPVVPTLVVQGDRDRMSGVALARRYVGRAPRLATLATLPGTHFVLIERLDEVGGRIERFLGEPPRPPRR